MGTPVVQPEQMLMAEEDGASLALDGPIAQAHANQALVTLRVAHLSNLNCYNSERYICYIGTPAASPTHSLDPFDHSTLSIASGIAGSPRDWLSSMSI